MRYNSVMLNFFITNTSISRDLPNWFRIQPGDNRQLHCTIILCDDFGRTNSTHPQKTTILGEWAVCFSCIAVELSRQRDVCCFCLLLPPSRDCGAFEPQQVAPVLSKIEPCVSGNTNRRCIVAKLLRKEHEKCNDIYSYTRYWETIWYNIVVSDSAELFSCRSARQNHNRLLRQPLWRASCSCSDEFVTAVFECTGITLRPTWYGTMILQ